MILVLLVIPFSGCRSFKGFPDEPLATRTEGDYRIDVYDTSGDGIDDYRERANGAGRIISLEGPGWSTNLDEVDARECRHLVLLLDGVPYDLVRELRDAGHLRLFHPPQRLIGVFPAMTDPSFATLFRAKAPGGIQSEYLSRETNEIVDGVSTYLDQGNKPGFDYMHYHTGSLDSLLLYVFPEWTLDREIHDLLSGFRKSDDRVFFAYIGATAGVGTIHGREGIVRYLEKFDRLAHRLLMEHRGRLKITMLADHGHTLTHPVDARLGEFLEERGVRLAERIETDEDVVLIRLGLVTVASIYTRRPAKIAELLLDHPGVDLCLYPDGDEVVVRSRAASARIAEREGRLRYDDSVGDPLGLRPALKGVAPDAGGFRDDRELFLATSDHEYPDALHRVWTAFHGLVENPPDLIVALEDGYANGRATHFFLMGDLASTHGSLNRMNSTTFIMSTGRSFPSPLRLEDAGKELEEWTGQPLLPLRPPR